MVLAGLTSPHRRATWLLGRWTAKRAASVLLWRHGEPRRYRELEVRATPSGAPEVWLGGKRAPLSLSISHRAAPVAL